MEAIYLQGVSPAKPVLLWPLIMVRDLQPTKGLRYRCLFVHNQFWIATDMASWSNKFDYSTKFTKDGDESALLSQLIFVHPFSKSVPVTIKIPVC